MLAAAAAGRAAVGVAPTYQCHAFSARSFGQMDGLDKTRIVLPGGRGELAIETEEEAQAADAGIDAASRRLREHEKPDLGGWTGGGVWEAAEVLAHVLMMDVAASEEGSEEEEETAAAAAEGRAVTVKGRRVLELGCGVGLVGLVAAGLGAHSVTLTDQVTFMAERNAAVNFPRAGEKSVQRGSLSSTSDGAMGSGSPRVTVQRLQWGDAEGVAALLEGGPFDVILAADIIYSSDYHRLLAETISMIDSDCSDSDHETVILNAAPDAGATVMDPASEFYDLMQSDEFGYELEDLSSTMPEVRQVIRDVGPQDAAVYGRGQMRVVRMIRRRRRRCKITSKL